MRRLPTTSGKAPIWNGSGLIWEPTILTHLHNLPISMISAASAFIPVCSFVGIYLSGKLMKRCAGQERIPGIALFSGTALLCLLFFF